MSYTTHWDLLDKNKEVVQTFTRICFSNHVDKPFVELDEDGEDYNGTCTNGPSTNPPRYFRYKFYNTELSDDVLEKYFRFVRATPLFTHLMPKGIKQMVADKFYDADLTKINGLQLFTILTVLRAVVEEEDLVKCVAQFNHRMKHSISHLGILKAAGTKNSQNYHHWLHQCVAQDNLNKEIHPDMLEEWNAPIPALETGLVARLHDTFQHCGDGYAYQNHIPLNWAMELLKEQEARRLKRHVKIKKEYLIRPQHIYPADHLQGAAW